jgi:hypothetical protein
MKTQRLVLSITIALAIIFFINLKLISAPPVVINVSGTISKDSTWDVDTVRVNGNITVNSNVTLTVGPGTIVKFMGPYYFTINGSIKALGNTNDSIIFTMNDTTGFMNKNSVNGGWQGFSINSTGSEFKKCIFKFIKNISGVGFKILGQNIIFNGNRFFSCATYQGLISARVTNGSTAADSMIIRNNLFQKNYSLVDNMTYGTCISISYSNKHVIRNNTFIGNLKHPANTYTSIYIVANTYSSISYIDSNVVKGNTGGFLFGASAGFFRNNLIESNTGYILFSMWNTEMKFINNKFLNNTFSGTFGGAGKLDFIGNIISGNNTNLYTEASGYFINNTIVNNSTYLQIVANSRPVFINNILWGNNGGGAQVSVSSYSNPSFYNCIIQNGNNGISLGTGTSFPAVFENIISTNPQFVNAYNDLRLINTSPAINAGKEFEDNWNYTTDLFGNKRIENGIIEIGASEKKFSNINVSSNITKDTMWIADTVHLNSSITVNSPYTLTIAPGTKIIVNGAYYITVQGSIQAKGTKNYPIIFKPADTTGFSNTSNTNGTWGGIIFSSTNYNSNLNYCIFEYFRRGLSVSQSSNISIDNCIYRYGKNVSDYNIYVYVSKVNFNNTMFYKFYNNNLYVIYFTNTNTSFQNCKFININNLDIYTSDNVKLINCIIANNYRIEFSQSELYAYNCTFANNGWQRIGYSNPIFYNTIIWNDIDIYGTLTYPKFNNCIVNTNKNLLGNNIFYRQNPMFINPTSGIGNNYDALNSDFRVIAISPAVNSGTTDIDNFTIPDYDYFGNKRINFGKIDIGAYEHTGNIPYFINHPAGGSICKGESYTFSVSVSDTVNYQWQKDGINITNATNPYYSISNIDDTHSGTYTCKITNAYGTFYSNSASLIVKQKPEVLLKPSNAWIPNGSAYLLNIPVTGYPPLSFEWKKNDTIFVNLSNKLKIDSFTYNNEGVYKCRISNSCGSDSIDPVSLFVEPVLINNNPEIICSGSTFQLSVLTNDSVKYKWYKDGMEIANANNNKFSIANVSESNNGNYSCKVTNGYQNYSSQSVLLQVKNQLKITSQLTSNYVDYNNQAVLSVTASGSEPISYYWYKNGIQMPNENSSILTIKNFTKYDEVSYRALLINMCGTIYSDVLNPIIVPQICMVTFDSTANHNLVTWERNSKYVFDHYNIYREGTVSGYYIKIGEVPYTALTVFEDTLVNPKSQAFLYKITATDLQGKETPLEACAYHKTIHLLVTKGVPTGYQLDWDEYIGFPYGTYKIYRSINGQPFEMVHEHSATTRTWTDFNAPDGYLQYFIAVEKSTPCVPYNPYKSSAGPFAQAMSNMEDNRLKTSNAISLTKQPENKTVCIGQAINLNVEATGDNLQYEWYKNGTKISGAATNKLEFTAVTTNDEANYYCIVKNNDTQVQSNNASIIVKYPPEVNVLSDKTEINKGANGSIAVIAYGSMPMTYQWYKNTNIISNATSSVLSFSSFAANDTGNYICKVKNSCAEISSQTIKVKLSETNTIDYFTKEEFDLQVYPNPFKNITTIKYSTEKPVKTKIQIVNIVGITIEEFSEEYNISGLRSFEIGNNLLPGMYYVKLIANEQEIIKTIKLLKY